MDFSKIQRSSLALQPNCDASCFLRTLVLFIATLPPPAAETIRFNTSGGKHDLDCRVRTFFAAKGEHVSGPGLGGFLVDRLRVRLGGIPVFTCDFN